MSVPITCLRSETTFFLSYKEREALLILSNIFQSTCSRNSDVAMEGRHSNHKSMPGKGKLSFLFSNSRTTLGLTSCPFNGYLGLIPANKTADT